MSDIPLINSYDALIQSIVNECQAHPLKEYSLKTAETGTQVLKLSRSDQAELAIALLHWYQHNHRHSQKSPAGDSVAYEKALYSLKALVQLLNRKLPLSDRQVMEFVDTLENDVNTRWQWTPGIIKQVRYYLQDHQPSLELLVKVKEMCDRLDNGYKDERKYGSQIRGLIASQTKTLAIRPGEAWADEARRQLNSLSEEKQTPWLQLIESCSVVSGGKPTQKWLKELYPFRDAIGLERFNSALLTWFPLVEQPRTQPMQYGYNHDLLLEDSNADVLKGLVWLCADQTEPALPLALSRLAISAYRKVPGIGSRCVKLGNACVWALGQIPTEEAIAQLALLKVKVKFGTAQKGIEKALSTAAERQGISRDEIEELSVPTYGLTDMGIRQEQLGDFTAELEITGTSSTILRWIKPDGKVQKSVPKAVKDQYAEELKDLKQAAKELKKMVPAQRDRIEALYLQQKTWDLATWKERYLNHPLVGTLARRMLWQFESPEGSTGTNYAVGIWNKGQFVNVAGEEIDWLNDQTHVCLWHPITASADTIQAWRTWLQDHEIQQPFKQAHRELYLLTPAEESTHVYSNRFAAHIIKQHQFNALCGQRGWKNQLRLMVDDSYNPAQLFLPQWDLRAEFWIEGIGDDYGTDTNETGTYLYLATDQIRFYPYDATWNSAHAYGGGYGSSTPADPLPLSDIPALVFTEVMRDVDLFVGVASVGNDPNWADGGPEGRHYDYWHSYSFGELSATAETRRQVLENLVPKLKKIRDRCTFRNRFLVVEGDIRTYKIHLGSGNILMEPNDQYLCIVSSGSSTANNVFLPFEGDKTLAVILSKAFLLAEDAKIEDPTILRQIKT